MDALVDSLARWRSITHHFQQLETLDLELLIDQMSNYLVDDSTEEISSFYNNAILTPLVVAGHLVQYQDYQNIADTPQSGHTSAIGFCIGLLTASVVTTSHDRKNLLLTARNAITLAMLVGGIVDLYDKTQLHGPWQSLAIAWAKPGEETVFEHILSSISEVSQFTRRWGLSDTDNNFKAYVSVHYDWNRVTITLPKSHVAEAKSRFASQGFTTDSVALHGCFHLLDHQDDCEALLRLSSDDEFLRVAQTTFESAIRDILVDTSHWYTVVRQAHKANPSATFVTFGLEKCIPPSLVRDIRPRHIISMADMDIFLAGAGLDDHFHLRPGSSADDIAVIGMSCKFAGSDDVNEFWDTLLTGKSQHQQVAEDRFPMNTVFRSDVEDKRTWYGNFLRDHDAFDHKFFKKSPREAASMDPQQRIMLQVVYQTIEQAGYFVPAVPATDVGCYVGFVSNDYQNNVAYHEPNAYTATGNLSSFIAGKISHHFGWSGPTLVIDTACSSSAVAIHQACRAILSGECSQAVAGGALVITSPL